jgi:hypothetical protein
MAKIDPVLVIGYEKIGTIPLDQWKQAILDDIEALRNEFGISYVTNSKLSGGHQRFGGPLVIKRLSTGATVKHLDTHYYRPACLGYHLWDEVQDRDSPAISIEQAPTYSLKWVCS